MIGIEYFCSVAADNLARSRSRLSANQKIFVPHSMDAPAQFRRRRVVLRKSGSSAEFVGNIGFGTLDYSH